MAKIKKIFFSILLFSINLNLTSSDLIKGKVVKVSDGDTIKIFVQDENRQYKVRLFGIDAPEKNQAYGKKSKSSLSDLIFGKIIKVTTTGLDRYNRILGKIILNNSDINLEMIKSGNAWVYTKYNKEPIYLNAEKIAREKKIGLWNDENPQPPWIFRKNEKQSKKKFKLNF